MPARTRYAPEHGQYVSTISCRDCSRQEQIVHQYTPGGRAPRETRVERTFRWHSGGERYLARCRECERTHVRAWREARQVSPAVQATSAPARPIANANRRFGIELELIFPRHVGRTDVAQALLDAGVHGWSVKSDGSVRGEGNGWEVVSPPMQGEAGMDTVRVACRVLRRLGAKPNRSCGFHVHHEIRDLNVEDVKRFVDAYEGNSDVIDGLVSSSRRNGANSYCARMSENERAMVRNLRDMGRAGYGITRYKNVNLQSYGRFGTVELRQHQGTCDFEKVRTWILLGQAMIEAARVEDVPQTSTVRDFVARLGSLLDETAGTFLLGRAVQFGHARVA